jgi:hypothetical protein
MADWSTPTLTSTYANFRQNLVDRDVDTALQFSSGSPTNVPTGAVKWDTTLNRWQRWSGTAWVELTTGYSLTGLTATSLNITGNTTLGDAGADSVTVNASTVSFVNTTTISGSLIFSGSVNFNGSVTLGDAVGDTVTVVAGTVALPAAGATFSTGVANFSAGLQVGGSDVVSATSTATFTNKTFNTAGAGNVLRVNGNLLTGVAGSGTITFPAATDTVALLAATQTFTNKTLTAPSISSPAFSGTATGTLVTAAAAAGGAGLRVPHGVAPTTPTNGDIWTSASGLFARINGATQQFPGGATLAAALVAMGGLGQASFTGSANTISFGIKLTGGQTLLLQAGTTTIGGNTTGTITFPTSYTTAPWGFVGGGSSGTGNAGDVHITANPTITGMSYLHSAGATGFVSWIAIGLA